MKSKKDIERALKQANLDVEINTESDRALLNRLVDMHGYSTTSARAARWTMPASFALRLAAIVAIVTAIALLITRHGPSEPGPTKAGHRTVSTLELATAVSLEKAFRQGGIEAVEKQYRKAFGTTPRDTETPSIEELLIDLETEMNDLRSEKI